MIFINFGNQSQNIVEHSVTELFSVFDGSVCVDGSMDKVELSFKNGIRSLVGQRLNDNVNEAISLHFSVFYHFKETSPNQGSAQNIVDVVEVFLKVGQRNLIDDVFNEGMVFEVQKDGLVIVGTIVVSNIISFWFDKRLNYIDGFVCPKKTDFNPVWSQSWMVFSVGSLSNSDFGLFVLVLWVPGCFDLVQGRFFKPIFSPLIKRKLLHVVMFLHFSDEINQSSIGPFILVEIF